MKINNLNTYLFSCWSIYRKKLRCFESNAPSSYMRGGANNLNTYLLSCWSIYRKNL